jgi:TPR repeat protein
VLRGNSWKWTEVETVYPDAYLASFRRARGIGERDEDIGFRCVIELKNEAATATPTVASPYVDDEKELARLKDEARRNNVASQAALGFRYALGIGDKARSRFTARDEVKPNLREAIANFDKASRDNDPQSQFRLAFIYQNGLDQPRWSPTMPRNPANSPQAFELYRKAAESRLPAAELEYARMLHNRAKNPNYTSDQSEADKNQARTYATRAAENGTGVIAASAAWLMRDLSKGTSRRPGETELQWAYIASNLGDSDAADWIAYWTKPPYDTEEPFATQWKSARQAALKWLELKRSKKSP